MACTRNKQTEVRTTVQTQQNTSTGIEKVLESLRSSASKHGEKKTKLMSAKKSFMLGT